MWNMDPEVWHDSAAVGPGEIITPSSSSDNVILLCQVKSCLVPEMSEPDALHPEMRPPLWFLSRPIYNPGCMCSVGRNGKETPMTTKR